MQISCFIEIPRKGNKSPAGFTRRNFNNGLGAAPQTVSWCSMDRAMVLISHLDDIPGDRAGGFDRIKYRPKFFDIFFEQINIQFLIIAKYHQFVMHFVHSGRVLEPGCFHNDISPAVFKF